MLFLNIYFVLFINNTIIYNQSLLLLLLMMVSQLFIIDNCQ